MVLLHKILGDKSQSIVWEQPLHFNPRRCSIMSQCQSTQRMFGNVQAQSTRVPKLMGERKRQLEFRSLNK